MANFMNLIFQKNGALSSLLDDLVILKMIVNSANANQMSFLIILMHGYDQSRLIDTEAIKNEFFYNTVLTKAKKSFLRY